MLRPGLNSLYLITGNTTFSFVGFVAVKIRLLSVCVADNFAFRCFCGGGYLLSLAPNVVDSDIIFVCLFIDRVFGFHLFYH